MIGRGVPAAGGAFEPLRREAIYAALEDELLLEIRAQALRVSLAPPPVGLSEESFRANLRRRGDAYREWLRERAPYADWEEPADRTGPADAVPGAPDAETLDLVRRYREFVGAAAPDPASASSAAA